MSSSMCKKLTLICVIVACCIQIADIVLACQRLQTRREYIEIMEARLK